MVGDVRRVDFTGDSESRKRIQGMIDKLSEMNANGQIIDFAAAIVGRSDNGEPVYMSLYDPSSDKFLETTGAIRHLEYDRFRSREDDEYADDA